MSHGLVGERRLVDRGRALAKLAEDVARQADLFAGLVDRGDGVAQRLARREVEGERDAGELALVIDRERRGGGGIVGDGAQRHLAAGGGMDVDVAQAARDFPSTAARPP